MSVQQLRHESMVGWGNLEVSVLDTLSEGVVVQDVEGLVVRANPAAERILGLSADELLGVTSIDPRWRAVHEDGSPWPGESRPAMTTLSTGEPVSGAIMGVHRPDGSLVWLSVSSRALRSGAGEAHGAVVTFVDVTERHHLMQSLRAAQRQIMQAFDSSPVGMVLLSPAREILQVNPAFEALVGWSEAELLSEGVRLLEHPEDTGVGAQMVRRLLDNENDTYRAERRFRHRNGRDIHVLMTSTLVRDELGEPAHFFSQVIDLSEVRRREMSWRFAAEHDPLTGLPNRRVFELAMVGISRSDPSERETTALLLIDLDRFKLVNDTHGHQRGDVLLRNIATALRGRIRSNDLVARIGGDEFAVVLANTDVNGAALVAQALIDVTANAIANAGMTGEGVGASIGITMFVADGCDPDALVRSADHALYAAKQAGRNRWSIA